jgi:signal peptidase I
MRTLQSHDRQAQHWPTYITWLFGLLALIAPTFAHTILGLGVAPVLSGSMRPMVGPGDLLITKNTRADSLSIGNIVAVHNPVTGIFYAHRIVSIQPSNGVLRIVTRGDANPTLDNGSILLSRNASVQRTIGYVKWFGVPLAFLISNSGRALGMTLLVGSSALALMLFALRRRSEAGAPVSTEPPCKLTASCTLRTAVESDVALDVDGLMRDITRYLKIKSYLTRIGRKL